MSKAEERFEKQKMTTARHGGGHNGNFYLTDVKQDLVFILYAFIEGKENDYLNCHYLNIVI